VRDFLFKRYEMGREIPPNYRLHDCRVITVGKVEIQRSSYKIIETHNKSYPIVVVSTSADERLYSFLSEIADSLRSLNYKGVILLDQIGCNGEGVSRFQVIDFNGSDFEKRSRRILGNQLPPDLLNCEGNYGMLR
jgi:hypothetical protein